MKKRIVLIIIACVMLAGCGKKEETWQDETVFGDININAETVNTNDIEETYEIDEYINIEELNETKMDLATVQNLRIYYNRIAEQFGVPYLSVTGYEEEVISDVIAQYTYEENGTGAYLTVNPENEMVKKGYFELMFNDNNEELLRISVGRIMAPVYGFMPNMKKYDLNKVYLDLYEAMKNEKGEYEYEYNKITLNVKRDYGYVYVTIFYP